MSKVPAEFYPKNVYRCPCRMYAVKQIYDDSLRNFADILDVSSIYKSASIFLFRTCVDNKESCFLMCDQHMLLILRVETIMILLRKAMMTSCLLN